MKVGRIIVGVVIFAAVLTAAIVLHSHHMVQKAAEVRNEAQAAMENGFEYNFGLLQCRGGLCVFHLDPDDGNAWWEVVTLTSGSNPQVLEIRFEPDIRKLGSEKGGVPKLLEEAGWGVFRPAGQKIMPLPLPAPPLSGHWEIHTLTASDQMFQKGLKLALATISHVCPTCNEVLFPTNR